MAASKMLGLVVTPTTFFSSMSLARLPLFRRSRDRSSSQLETPAAESAAVGVALLILRSSLGCPGDFGPCLCKHCTWGVLFLCLVPAGRGGNQAQEERVGLRSWR